MLEDSEIIELFFERSEHAIEELSAKYGKACKSISKNILKNELDAEECVNDSYLAAWNTIPPQRPELLGAFIFRIVRNISIAKYHSKTAMKRNSHYDTSLDELEDCFGDSITVENEIEANELSRCIDDFLDTLDRDSRMMFMRRYWYSDSIGDIAKKFHTSENNVYVKLSRIRGKLKKYLLKEGYDL